MGDVRFTCRRCGGTLTRPVRRLEAVPERHHDGGFEFDPTMAPGTWATEPRRVVPTDDGRSVTIDSFQVLNREDLTGLTDHPDPRRHVGCCGRDGGHGPNIVCPRCGAEIGVIRDDCWTPQEVRLDPSAVRTVDLPPAP